MMKLRSKLLVAAAALAALAALFAPIEWANAGSPQALMCQGDVSGASTGARQIGGTGSAVPSQTLYTLNSNGCALIAQGDMGYFQSQGFVQNPSQTSAFLITGLLPSSGTTDIVGPTLPAGAYLQQIIVSDIVASTVTGGLAIGTTANGTDIVAALTTNANGVNFVTDANLKLRVFSATAPQVIHVAPVTSSNGANLNMTFVYGFF
jgi:hypothetical protein